MRMSQGYDEAAAGTPLDRRWGREGFSQLMVADLIHGAAAALWVRHRTAFVRWAGRVGHALVWSARQRMCPPPASCRGRQVVDVTSPRPQERHGTGVCGGRESKFLDFGYIAGSVIEFHNKTLCTNLGTGLARTGTNTGTPREPPKRLPRKERKQRTQTRDTGGEQGPHLHEQDFGRTITGAQATGGSPAPDKAQGTRQARSAVLSAQWT